METARTASRRAGKMPGVELFLAGLRELSARACIAGRHAGYVLCRYYNVGGGCQQSCLGAEKPERAAPPVGVCEQAADQRAEERRYPPDGRQQRKQLRPYGSVEQLFNCNERNRHQTATAKALREPSKQHDFHGRCQC